MQLPPGWYPDPTAPSAWRWWDGTAWTGHQAVPDTTAVPANPASTPRPDRPDRPAARKPRPDRPVGMRPFELAREGARTVFDAVWSRRRQRSTYGWAALVLLALALVERYAPVPAVVAIAPVAVAVAVAVVARATTDFQRTERAVLWRYVGASVAATAAATVAASFAAALLPLVVTAVIGLLFVAVAVVVLRSVFTGGGTTTAPPTRGASSHINADGRPKVAYRTETEARRAAVKYEKDRGEAMNAYRCSTCPAWHIGHRK